MYKKKRNKRNKIKKRKQKKKNALTRFFAVAVVFFLSSTFLRASAAWSSSRLREIDSHEADHFRGVAQMVLAARFVGVNKTSCHFCPTKKSAGGLDKRGNLAYNHGILLLRSAPLLILLIVLTRLPLSGVRGRAVLLAGFMFPTFAPWASRFALFSIPLVRHAL